MKIKDLKANRRNPRKISSKKLSMLKASVEKFGDLSGFVFNRRSGQLVSGHQRSKVLPPDATIKIEVKHKIPTQANTVAEGYVEIDGERFKYREVDADEVWETEALLAANKHGGDWDNELLKIIVADVPSIDLSLAGFEIGEIEVPDLPEAMPVAEAVAEAEQTDEEYLAENPGPDSQISKENISTAFDAVEENTEPQGRRIVLIIDCSTDEMKKDIKEKIRPLVEEAGGKFF